MFVSKKMSLKIAGVTTAFVCALLVIIAGAAVGSALYPDYVYIKTTEDLYKIAENLNGNYVISKSDLSLPDDWAPVGTKNRPFTGTIDGNGATIDGYSDGKRFVKGDSGEIYYGLIGYNKGTIKNIRFYLGGFDFNSASLPSHSGLVFGQACAFNYGTVENVYVQHGGGDVIIDLSGEQDAVIGLVTGVSYSNVVGCGTNRSINGVSLEDSNLTLGLVGENSGGTIEKSSAIYNVYGENIDEFSSAKIGALCGASENATYENCFSKYIVSGSWKNSLIGGITGTSQKSSFSDLYSEWLLQNDAEASPFGGISATSSSDAIDSCVSTSANHFGASQKLMVGAIVANSSSSTMSNNYFCSDQTAINMDGCSHISKESLTIEKLGWDGDIWEITNGDVRLK